MPHQLLEPCYFAILDDNSSKLDDCLPREMISTGIMLAQVYRDDNERWIAAVRSKGIEFLMDEAVERYERMAEWAEASKRWIALVQEHSIDTHQLQESLRQLKGYVDDTELMVDPRRVA